jgi:hypothetical protein
LGVGVIAIVVVVVVVVVGRHGVSRWLQGSTRSESRTQSGRCTRLGRCAWTTSVRPRRGRPQVRRSIGSFGAGATGRRSRQPSGLAAMRLEAQSRSITASVRETPREWEGLS